MAVQLGRDLDFEKEGRFGGRLILDYREVEGEWYASDKWGCYNFSGKRHADHGRLNDGRGD
jgi:hypothetical protein